MARAGVSVLRGRRVTLTRKVKTPVKASDMLRDNTRLATGTDMRLADAGYARWKEQGGRWNTLTKS